MSNFELIISSEAELEIQEAYRWYESCVEGLGSEYLRALDAVFNSIARNPNQYPSVHKTIRMALLKRFPYEVFYQLEKDMIFVIAVFHAKRNPKTWQNRN